MLNIPIQSILYRYFISQIALDFRLEVRNKYSLYSVLLYVSGTVFISYLAFRGNLNPAVWNALFWIILLFASIQASFKSFLGQSQGNFIYQYSLLPPQALILAKIAYNMGLLLLIAFTGLGFMSIFLGNPIQDFKLYAIGVFLGSLGFAGILSLVSAIASRSNSNFSLSSILSFPLLLPLLLTAIKLSKNAMDGLDWSVSTPLIIMLFALNTIVWVLAYLLFPYLWRE